MDFKVREEDGNISIGERGGKDDVKQQMAQQRAGSKQQQASSVMERARMWDRSGSEGVPTPATTPTSRLQLHDSLAKQASPTSTTAATTPVIPAANARTESDLFSPPVQRASATSDTQKREIHKTSPADFSFSSIPSPPATTHTSLGRTSLGRGRSGDPIPSAIELPDAIGQDTGRALDEAVDSCKSAVMKARSLYSIWKNGENESLQRESQSPPRTTNTDTTSSGITSESLKQQAKEAVASVKESYDEVVAPKLAHLKEQAEHTWKEQVLPQLNKAAKAYTGEPKQATSASSTVDTKPQEASPELVDEDETALEKAQHLYQRQIAPKMKQAGDSIRHAYEENVPLENREQLHAAKEGVMSKVRMVWYKVLDVWEGEEPIVREYAMRGIHWVQKYGLEVPLLFLATLLVLWASISFVGWMAFPTAPVIHDMPGAYTAHPQPWQHHHGRYGDVPPPFTGASTFRPSQGPSQNVQGPSAMDRLNMHVHDADDRIKDWGAGVADRVTDRVGHVTDAIPSVQGVNMRVQDRLHHVTDAIPSVHSIVDKVLPLKPGVSTKPEDHVIERKDQAGHVVEQLEGMPPTTIGGRIQEGIKDAMPSVHLPNLNSLKQQIPSTQELKDKLTPPPPHAAHPHDHAIEYQDGFNGEVKETLPPDSLATRVNEKVKGFAERAGELKDRIVNKLRPGVHQQGAGVHYDVLDPEDHVIEQLDHGHVIEGINV